MAQRGGPWRLGGPRSRTGLWQQMERAPRARACVCPRRRPHGEMDCLDLRLRPGGRWARGAHRAVRGVVVRPRRRRPVGRPHGAGPAMTLRHAVRIVTGLRRPRVPPRPPRWAPPWPPSGRGRGRVRRLDRRCRRCLPVVPRGGDLPVPGWRRRQPGAGRCVALMARSPRASGMIRTRPRASWLPRFRPARLAKEDRRCPILTARLCRVAWSWTPS